MQWSCDIYLCSRQCYNASPGFMKHPGELFSFEWNKVKWGLKLFWLIFYSILIFANYDRSSRVSPESVSEAGTQRVRQSRSQVTSRSRSRESESGQSQSGEWGEVTTRAGQWTHNHLSAYWHTRSHNQPGLRLWREQWIDDCGDSTKRIQLCFDGGI